MTMISSFVIVLSFFDSLMATVLRGGCGVWVCLEKEYNFIYREYEGIKHVLPTTTDRVEWFV